MSGSCGPVFLFPLGELPRLGTPSSFASSLCIFHQLFFLPCLVFLPFLAFIASLLVFCVYFFHVSCCCFEANWQAPRNRFLSFVLVADHWLFLTIGLYIVIHERLLRGARCLVLSSSFLPFYERIFSGGRFMYHSMIR